MAHISGDATSDAAQSPAARSGFAAPRHDIDPKRQKLDRISNPNVAILNCADALGCFPITPMLPIMRREAGFSLAAGGRRSDVDSGRHRER